MVRVAKPATVKAAVEAELAAIAKRAPGVESSSLALSALALAGMVDSSEHSVTSRTAAARELRETLDRLAELAPAAKEGDGVDALLARSREKLKRKGKGES